MKHALKPMFSKAWKNTTRIFPSLGIFPLPLVALLWLAGAGTAPGAGEKVLVRDGKPVATIVTTVPKDAVQPAVTKGKTARGKAGNAGGDESLAVRVLVEWIKKITDAELPVADKAPAGAPAIYIGRAAEQAGLKLDDIASPSREGVRIVADARGVFIAGQSEAATLKAVCRFLEELGCRYLMDGPLGEVFPRTPTLKVGTLNITEQPGLLWRNPKGPSWNARLWKAWNGAGGEPFGHAHSWGGYVAPSLFATHPDFFAMGADGQRKEGGWLCTANPGLRAHFASNVVAAIAQGRRHPSLSPTDGRGYCQCPACKAQDNPQAREPSSGTISITDRYVDFFDWIARRIAPQHPESVLSFYCYADYTQPPTAHRPLATNLCAMIAPIRYCRLHPVGHPGCPSREQQQEMLAGWAAVASRLGYYNYMYNLADGTLPFFKFSACRKEFPYLAERGLTYMTIEVLSNWQSYGPQIYLSLRLAYNPRADAAALMEDYWQKFYGPKAAPFMKTYWMNLDAAQQRLTTHAGSFFGLGQLYTPEFLAQCEGLLAQAAAAVKGDAVLEQRVALHAEGLRSARAYRTICDALNRGDFAAALRDYELLLARLRAAADKGWANREYATAYLERFLGPTVRAGAAAAAAPNRVLQVLPDRWRFAFDETDAGLVNGFARADFNDTAWPLVATRDTTLDAQGHDKLTVLWYRTPFSVPPQHGALTLFFGEVDGVSEVFVNGNRLAVPAPVLPPKKAAKASTLPAGTAAARKPFAVDVTAAVRPGENVLALRVDHTKMTDLALGGILRPVVLIEKPKPLQTGKD